MKRLALLLLVLFSQGAWAVDVDALWNYQDPAGSEQRFRSALVAAVGDDALVLRTQIARTYSLRKRFDDAHAELDAIAPAVARAGPEVRVRALLERGRTRRSAGQPRDAEPLFLQAVEVAEGAGLRGLAGDAIHMVALVQPDLERKRAWHQRLLDFVGDSGDPKVRRWQAVAYNNLGSDLREAGRFAEALQAFEQALAAYRRDGKTGSVRIAQWQVANTLRLLRRIDDALQAQQALLAELQAAGETDPYVYEELALLHAACGDEDRAAHYRALHREAAARR